MKSFLLSDPPAFKATAASAAATVRTVASHGGDRALRSLPRQRPRRGPCAP